MGKGPGIRGKMLLTLLPVIIVILVALTVISTVTSQNMIVNQTMETATASLTGSAASVDGSLEEVRSTAINISRMVSSTYHTTPMEAYGEALSAIIQDNDSVLGSGLWFEPNTFDPAAEYVGPYWYKDGGEIVVTWDYSNADYDYFSQEYYTNAKSLTSMSAIITDPYYDETSGIVMASCSAPIFDENNAFLGCVTVDMELGNIQNIISSIHFGKTGYAILTTGDGVYIQADTPEKTRDAMNIASDSSIPSSASSAFLSGSAGEVSWKNDGVAYDGFYDTIPGVGWKLMLIIRHAEIVEQVRSLAWKMTILCIVAVILVAVLIFVLVNTITKYINVIRVFVDDLAQGNYTVEPIRINRKDELEVMSDSLDTMYSSSKEVITSVKAQSVSVNDASNTLSAMSEELTAQFNKIQENISGVNEAMMSSSAATEELSASVHEVDNSMEALANMTDEENRMAEEIRGRADGIVKSSQESYENAISMTTKIGGELESASENARVIDQIGNLTSAIAGIAEQINLLSLNASIEAARAGEHGKGFAVVAGEINQLANETAETVGQIQNTVTGVQQAFEMLLESSRSLLEFVNDTVTPDYDKFVGIGKTYGEDASAFGRMSEETAEMASNIKASIREISNAIQSIAESTQETAARSADVTDATNAVTDAVTEITTTALESSEIARELNTLVDHFRLD